MYLQDEPEEYALPLTLKQKNKPASPAPGLAVDTGPVQADGLINGSQIQGNQTAA